MSSNAEIRHALEQAQARAEELVRISAVAQREADEGLLWADAAGSSVLRAKFLELREGAITDQAQAEAIIEGVTAALAALGS